MFCISKEELILVIFFICFNCEIENEFFFKELIILYGFNFFCV